MDKDQVSRIQQLLGVLNGLTLDRITRAGDLLCLQFGELVTRQGIVRNEDGKLVVGKVEVGKYGLELDCFFRIVCAETLVIAKNDLYQISEQAASKIPDGMSIPEDFDYDILSNNRLDEIIATTLSDLRGFTVKSLKISRMGDLHIVFENGFSLDAFADVSDGEELWRFFGREENEQYVVTGQGLSIDVQSDEPE